MVLLQPGNNARRKFHMQVPFCQLLQRLRVPEVQRGTICPDDGKVRSIMDPDWCRELI